MAGQAYTPGLLVTGYTELVRLRELPLPGRLLVKVGDAVQAHTPVLAAELPGEIEIVRIADLLGLDPDLVPAGLKVRTGDKITKGRLICEVRTFFGLFNNQLHSPTSGTVEFFTEANAHLGVRAEPQPITVEAYIGGTVVEVEEGKSVSIETRGAFIQGIFGVGGERQGDLRALDCANDALITPELLKEQLRNKVIVGGSAFSIEALQFCAAHGAKAVVTGSIDSQTLHAFAGEEISVSVTGDEDVPFTLIITEGFGRLPLSERVAQLARTLDGKPCSVNGATQVRAGATRPEVIVTLDQPPETTGLVSLPALGLGSRIRLIRVPHFGEFARVTELPVEPEKVPSGAVVRVLRAELESGEVVTVPRSNVELV